MVVTRKRMAVKRMAVKEAVRGGCSRYYKVREYVEEIMRGKRKWDGVLAGSQLDIRFNNLESKVQPLLR